MGALIGEMVAMLTPSFESLRTAAQEALRARKFESRKDALTRSLNTVSETRVNRESVSDSCAEQGLVAEREMNGSVSASRSVGAETRHVFSVGPDGVVVGVL